MNGARYSRVNMAAAAALPTIVSCRRVDGQHRPQRQRRLVQVDVVGRQVLERPFERLRDVLAGLPIGQRRA